MSDEPSGYAGYRERVLIVLAGTSPAVISETLYVLAQPAHRLSFAPTRIVVVTTTEGRTLLQDALLTPAANSSDGRSRVDRLTRMAQDLSSETGFSLNATDIRVPNLDDGSEIVDAHSVDELDAMGQLIFDVLREATTAEDSAVFFSLSGGRKSMSHISGQCMSALARPQDKLLHVIVEPSWLESVPEFLYPRNGGHDILHVDAEGNKLAVAQGDIKLLLTEQPYFRLRPMLDEAAHRLKRSLDSLGFQGVLALTNEPAQRVTIEIDPSSGDVWISEAPMRWPTGASPGFLKAYMTLLAQEKRLHHFPTDAEMLRLLAIWESQTTPDGWGSGDRRKRILDYFQGLPGHEAKLALASFDLSVANQLVRLSTDGSGCSLTTRAKSNMSPALTHLKEALAAALPPMLSPSDFDISRERGWRVMPDGFDIMMGGRP